MSGSGQLPVQTCIAVWHDAQPANTWLRGVPVDQSGFTGTSMGSPSNLVAASPPTLLERFELYSYSIAFGVYFGTAAAQASTTVELALLVNDHVVHTDRQPVTLYGTNPYRGTGSWTSDLVNRVVVGPRDRLGLRLGVLPAAAAIGGEAIYIAAAAEFANDAKASPVESSISYDVIDLPGRRRL